MDGCGGHGGRDFARVLRGVVTVTDFRVAAGERVGAEGDVTVQCQTAEVEGELISLASTGSGANGGSIAIEAQSDIVVAGRIEAGAGTDGSSTGPGGNGGTGGSVALKSAAGSVTLGVTGVVAGVRPKQAGGGASLQSGDGGNGGNGTFGGAGGNGGDITIECPKGTWHIVPDPNMFVLGSGGHGGAGHVPGAQLGVTPIPEQLPNAGGASGIFEISFAAAEGAPVAEVTGPQGQVARLVQVPDGTVSGGVGGDAGNAQFGDEAAAARRPAAATVHPRQAPPPLQVRGADGGPGRYQAGAGGDVVVAGSDRQPGQDVVAIGGDGGRASSGHEETLDFAGVTMQSEALHAGSGGGGIAIGRDGADGGPGEDGERGGHATGIGGAGGAADDWTTPSEHWYAGEGGLGGACGGEGGRGGAGTETSRGGNGGTGGDAIAQGGMGGSGFPLADKTGAGGKADAEGGSGGNGGDGNPAGSGAAGGTAEATGGVGNPTGKATEQPGTPGAAGQPLLPPGPGDGYHLITGTGRPQDYGVLQIYRYLWSQHVEPRQVVQVTLGSQTTNPVYAHAGQSVVFTPAKGRIWVATTNQAVFVYDDPLLGGDRGPGLRLTPNGGTDAGFVPVSVWYDATRDIIYCAAGARVYAWSNAAAMTANRSADRTITLSSLGAPWPNAITGDATRNLLFATAAGTVRVYDNISAANGATSFARSLNVTGALSCAYDGQRDRLYVGVNDAILSQHAVKIINSAAGASGNAISATLSGFGAGTAYPVALAVFPALDTLAAGLQNSDLLLFENASAIAGNSSQAPAQREPLQVISMGMVPVGS